MKLEDFKKYKDLVEYIGIDEKELWKIIIGHTTNSLEIAQKLHEVCGIHPRTLMFSECVRIRPGFLEWFAARTGLTKTEVWHVFQGERAVNDAKAKVFAKFTGIPSREWQTSKAWMICLKFEDKC